MIEGNRQKKFSKVIQKELSLVLQFSVKIPGVQMLTLSGVRTTKDLLISRAYIMAFPPASRPEAVRYLNENTFQIRKLLADKIRHQVRQVPEIEFFEDDTLDYAEKIDSLFRNLKKDQPAPHEEGEDDAE